MGFTLLDCARLSRTAVLVLVADATLLATRIPHHADVAPPNVSLEVTEPLPAAHDEATAHEDAPPVRCVAPFDGASHRFRARVDGMDVLLELHHRTFAVRDGGSFTVDTQIKTPIGAGTDEIFERSPYVCVGHTWFWVERPHRYVCGNDRSPAYDASAQVVIDAID